MLAGAAVLPGVLSAGRDLLPPLPLPPLNIRQYHLPIRKYHLLIRQYHLPIRRYHLPIRQYHLPHSSSQSVCATRFLGPDDVHTPRAAAAGWIAPQVYVVLNHRQRFSAVSEYSTCGTTVLYQVPRQPRRYSLSKKCLARYQVLYQVVAARVQ